MKMKEIKRVKNNNNNKKNNKTKQKTNNNKNKKQNGGGVWWCKISPVLRGSPRTAIRLLGHDVEHWPS